jgi:ribosome recycling factor
MFDADLADAKSRLDKAIAALNHDFDHIRTGRASPVMVENVPVEAYGSIMPLNQCASITVPEPTQLAIKPWDKGLVKAIEKALVAASLGMAPNSDGHTIRMQLPPLSTERRKQLAGQAKDACEKCKVSMRNVRRDVIKAVETKGKEQKAPEDLVKKTKEKIDALLKEHEAAAEKRLVEKTKDIMEV